MTSPTGVSKGEQNVDQILGSGALSTAGLLELGGTNCDAPW